MKLFGRDAQFSLTYGGMCSAPSKTRIHNCVIKPFDSRPTSSYSLLMNYTKTSHAAGTHHTVICESTQETHLVTHVIHFVAIKENAVHDIFTFHCPLGFHLYMKTLSHQKQFTTQDGITLSILAQTTKA